MTRPVLLLSLVSLVLALLLVGCPSSSGPPASEPTSISLASLWPEVRIENPQTVSAELSVTGEVTFDEARNSNMEWNAVRGISDLRLEDGKLMGRTTDELPVLRFDLPHPLGVDDEIWSVEFTLRTDEGSRASLLPLLPRGGPPVEAFFRGMMTTWPLSTALMPGEDLQTYEIRMDQVMALEMPMAHGDFSSFLLRPTDQPGAEFAIESIRFLFRSDYLASISSGLGWQGLGDVYRETLVGHTPEAFVFDLRLPEDPWLDLAVGSVAPSEASVPPPRFVVRVVPKGGTEETAADLRPGEHGRWSAHRVDLASWAGQKVELRLETEAAEHGMLAYWGSPTIRQSLKLTELEHPKTIVLFVADTLRKDRLDAWGHDRATAPVLKDLTENGVLFADTVAQSTWTKGSVSSILTSLYPGTSGIVNLNDRISAAETTLAEVFREAGFATFATSSIPFTGQLTNLHQGIEVMYEYGANEASEGSYESKTSKIWVDAYLDWLELHTDVPTFAVVHAMDPHSPFKPPPPYDQLWTDETSTRRFAEQGEALAPHIENPMLRRFLAATRDELDVASVDVESFLAHEQAWYDASIRHMDDNMGRIVDALEEHGLKDSTLFAFVSDHGEEFLEHGNHWHGLTVYGEVANVPMALWGRDVPEGIVIEQTVQTIDLFPTMVELAGLPIPKRIQGRSLVPLLHDSEALREMPAFTERRVRNSDPEGTYASFSIIDGGWKLIWNVDAPGDVPRYELYDHTRDPLNQADVAGDHPEVVERLAVRLERWRDWSEAAKLDDEAATSQMSAEELEQLRSLGYVD